MRQPIFSVAHAASGSKCHALKLRFVAAVDLCGPPITVVVPPVSREPRLEVLEAAARRAGRMRLRFPRCTARRVAPDFHLSHLAGDRREPDEHVSRGIRAVVGQPVRGEEDDEIAGAQGVPHVLPADGPT